MSSSPATTFDDDISSDPLAAMGTSVLDEPETSESDYQGPRCEKCDAPLVAMQSSVCRKCGWYASLGMFVEIDQRWEQVTDPAAGQQQETRPAPSHLAVWAKLLPRWAWFVIACVLLVIIESIVARFTTPETGTLRTTWSLTQLTIGFLTFVCCHFVNFMILVSDDASFALLDVILKPIKVWSRVIKELPRRLTLFTAGVCGLTAVVMSFLVIGAIPYERLWDWGIEPPPKQNLVDAVAQRAQKIKSEEKSLEDALNELTNPIEEEGDKAKPRLEADCVIIGYRVSDDQSLHTVLVATEYYGRLVYAGRVAPHSKTDGDDLLRMLENFRSKRPFINLEMKAIWVVPKIACRISYTEQLRGGRFEDPRLERVLNVINFGGDK
jgi:hypothetical protein